MHKRSSENEIVVLEKLAIRIFRRPFIMNLHKTRTSTVAWAPPTKIGYFAHRPKQNRPINFSRAKPTLLFYSLPRSSENMDCG